MPAPPKLHTFIPDERMELEQLTQSRTYRVGVLALARPHADGTHQ